MHIPKEGTRVWVMQAENTGSGAVAYIGDANVVAIIPCSNCYTSLRAVHRATSRHGITPSEIALVGTVCQHPVGFFARTDGGDTIPVITAEHPGTLAVPILSECEAA